MSESQDKELINRLRDLLMHSLVRNHPISESCSACEMAAKESFTDIREAIDRETQRMGSK